MDYNKMDYNKMYKMDYDIKNRVTKCLKCGKHDFDEESRYCPECGTSLYNKCSNYECKKIIKSDEKFCKYCGSKSLFLNLGYLNAPKKDTMDDLPF